MEQTAKPETPHRIDSQPKYEERQKLFGKGAERIQKGEYAAYHTFTTPEQE